jgi:hypothetical protein
MAALRGKFSENWVQSSATEARHVGAMCGNKPFGAQWVPGTPNCDADWLPNQTWAAFWHTGEDVEGDNAFLSFCMKPIFHGVSFVFECQASSPSSPPPPYFP